MSLEVEERDPGWAAWYIRTGVIFIFGIAARVRNGTEAAP
jgi:hypothetical protein